VPGALVVQEELELSQTQLVLLEQLELAELLVAIQFLEA
jgi:hypothetical protein